VQYSEAKLQSNGDEVTSFFQIILNSKRIRQLTIPCSLFLFLFTVKLHMTFILHFCIEVKRQSDKIELKYTL
jgi:hypothetical protein